jgi:hypothetical protein
MKLKIELEIISIAPGLLLIIRNKQPPSPPLQETYLFPSRKWMHAVRHFQAVYHSFFTPPSFTLRFFVHHSSSCRSTPHRGFALRAGAGQSKQIARSRCYTFAASPNLIVDKVQSSQVVPVVSFRERLEKDLFRTIHIHTSTGA